LTANDQLTPTDKGLVVLVEDDAIVRMISAELLRDLHYEVAEAASGEEALAVLESAPADVLITDLNLPGMSGDELVRAARRLSPRIRVIFASGDVSKAAPDRANPLRAGSDLMESNRRSWSLF
jgi:CheY-like chemotaxis protein